MSDFEIDAHRVERVDTHIRQNGTTSFIREITITCANGRVLEITLFSNNAESLEICELERKG